MDDKIVQKLKLPKFQKLVLLRDGCEKTPFTHLGLPTTLTSDTDLIIHYVYDLTEMKEVIYKLAKDERLELGMTIYLLYPKKRTNWGIHQLGVMRFFPILALVMMMVLSQKPRLNLIGW